MSGTEAVLASMVRYRCDACSEDKRTINDLQRHYRDRHFAYLSAEEADNMKIILEGDADESHTP